MPTWDGNLGAIESAAATTAWNALFGGSAAAGEAAAAAAGLGTASSGLAGTGAAAGSLFSQALPVVGQLLSMASMLYGTGFGPNPSVGPNGQAWLGTDPWGFLDVLASSGDNGIGPDVVGRALAPGVNSFNMLMGEYDARLRDLPGNFQVRAGEMGMDPTIELGKFMAPLLNAGSLGRTLLARGYVSDTDEDIAAMLAALGGPDPERIFSSGKWLEPESIHPIWRPGIGKVADTEFLSFDSAAASPFVQEAYAEMSRRGIPINESTLAQWAAGTYSPAGGSADYAAPGFEQSMTPVAQPQYRQASDFGPLIENPAPAPGMWEGYWNNPNAPYSPYNPGMSQPANFG